MTKLCAIFRHLSSDPMKDLSNAHQGRSGIYGSSPDSSCPRAAASREEIPVSPVRRRQTESRAVPILCLSFNWTRHRPYRMSGSRILGGPDIRRYSLFLPVDRRTLHDWSRVPANTSTRGQPYRAPSGTCVTALAPNLTDSFVTSSLVPVDRDQSWSINVEVPDSEHVRLAMRAKNRHDIDSPVLAPRDLRWLKLYWAAPEDEAEAFLALAEIAPAHAVDIYLNGFEIKGQASERRRLKAPQPSWLTSALEHGDKHTRERAIAAIGVARFSLLAREDR